MKLRNTRNNERKKKRKQNRACTEDGIDKEGLTSCDIGIDEMNLIVI